MPAHIAETKFTKSEICAGTMARNMSAFQKSPAKLALTRQNVMGMIWIKE